MATLISRAAPEALTPAEDPYRLPTVSGFSLASKEAAA